MMNTPKHRPGRWGKTEDEKYPFSPELQIAVVCDRIAQAITISAESLRSFAVGAIFENNGNRDQESPLMADVRPETVAYAKFFVGRDRFEEKVGDRLGRQVEGGARRVTGCGRRAEGDGLRATG